MREFAFAAPLGVSRVLQKMKRGGVARKVVSAFAALALVVAAPAVAGAVGADDVVKTVSPVGTVINVFDYDANAINNGHSLKFSNGNFGGKADYSNNWKTEDTDQGYMNAWTGDANKNGRGVGGGAFENIVSNELGSDGFPVLKEGLRISASNSDVSKAESLAYLFSPHAKGVAGRTTYANVTNLLQINDQNYFEYDSDDFFAALDQNGNFKVTVNDPNWKNKGNNENAGYFPFNEVNDTGDGLKDGQPKNYHFGTTMSTRFLQTKGGIRPGSNNDALMYEFSGDDDVWIFIDGKLVADLGGIHDEATVTINFQNGDVKRRWNKNGKPEEKTAKLGQILGTGSDTLPDNTLHTLDFFYLERGEGESNLKLEFNLVTVPESDITKTDAEGKPVSGAEFELYAADEDFNINEGDGVVATATTDADGKVELKKDNQPIYFEDLFNSKGYVYYVLRETGVPDGYRASADMWLKYDQQTGALLSQNRWTTGAFAEGRLTTTLAVEGGAGVDPYEFVESLNGFKSAEQHMNAKGELEEGQFFAVVLRFAGEAKSEVDLQYGTNWHGTYPNKDESGKPDGSWSITAKNAVSMYGICDAVRSGGAFEAAPNANGQYQIVMDSIPGNVEDYYHFILKNSNGSIGDKASDVRWTVGFYYTEADDLSDVTEANTVRLRNSDLFDRQFGASLNVTDMANQLYIQKNDENGNPVNGAEFKIYGAADVSIDAATGEPSLHNGAQELGTVTTGNLQVGKVQREGAAVYPGNDPNNRKLQSGKTYYLVESDPAPGYAPNNSFVEVRVTNTETLADGTVAGGEVLANATAYGTKPGDSDGVSVVRGVGRLSPALTQFAHGLWSESILAGGDVFVDSTLHDIKVALETTADDPAQNKWQREQVNGEDYFHLAYGSDNAVIDYGPKVEGDPVHSQVEDGWSKLVINQCTEHKVSEQQFETIDPDLDLAPVFEGYTVVEFTNQTVNDLEISKTVTSDDDQYPLNDLKQKDFTFELKLKVPDANAVKPLNEYKVEILDAATGLVVDNEVPFDADGNNGKATFKLKDGQKAVVRGLPAQTEYDVCETYPGNGFTVSAGVNDNAAENTANVDGTLADADANSAAIDPVKVAYTNSYNVTPAADTLTATKTVASEVPGNKYTMKGGEFEFQLVKDGAVVQTKHNDANGTVAFDKIEFTQPGAYTYTLSESGVDPNKAPGVSMDDSSYTITYTVVDKDAQLVIESKKISRAGKDVGSITFENVYKTSSADLAIGGTKSITGIDGVTVERKPVSGEFEFVLTPESSALADGTTLTANEVPMPDGKLGGTAQAENTESTFSFDKITYASAGTYTYRVTEAKGNDPTIIYSEQDFEVVVTVTEGDLGPDGKMRLNASVEVNGDGATPIAFVNTCKPTPATASIPGGTKTLDGRALAEGEFSFELKDASGNVVESVKNAKNGTFAFGDLTFDKPGIYTYTVTEANRGETIDGVTYDSTVYNIVIDVRENPDVTVHELVAKVTSVLDGKGVSSFDFTNTFKAAPAKASIAATKVLTGRDLVEGEFAFQLKDKDGKVIATAHNDAEGKIAFGQIVFDTPGVYAFTMSEIDGDSKGMAYDGTVYQVTVEVVDDGSSELKATVSYNADPVFKNVHTPAQVPGGGTSGGNTPNGGNGGDKLAATGDNALAPIALAVIALAGAALVVTGRFLTKRR